VQIHCLIVDDNQPFLDAARLLLEREGIAVVGLRRPAAKPYDSRRSFGRMSSWSTSGSVTKVASTSHGG
jgi:hypothetical protein